MGENDRVLVCTAWPYANGPVHLGHVAGNFLPGDIFARFHRLSGSDVLMVSGSDQHGTPITVQAEETGTTPAEVAAKYHRMNSAALSGLGISFDLYLRTTHPAHKSAVQGFFLRLLENGYIYEQDVLEPWCANCSRFLPDRYVEGRCPECGGEGARGDQCDSCGKTLDPQDLVEPACKLCGSAPEFRTTPHFYFRLSAFQERLGEYVSASPHWKPNVMNFTRNWLAGGLKDRAATRDLTWGVEVPLDGWDDKRMYVWLEAVMGYYTTSREWARRRGEPDAWKRFWEDPSARGYYFLGKDNIPFHTIIWPALLIGHGGLNLPYDVPANEYLMLDSAQFSKSRRHAIYLGSYLERGDVDPMRYHLTAVMPENRDSDFTWEDFVRRVNNELVGTLGNFVHRTLTFTHKHFGEVPGAHGVGPEEEAVRAAIRENAQAAARAYSECRFRDALRCVMSLATEGNRYFDHRAPWSQVKEDREACAVTLATCMGIVKALNVMMAPVLPHAAGRLWRMYNEAGEEPAAPAPPDDPDEWPVPGSLPGDPGEGGRLFAWSDALVPPAPGAPLRAPETLFKKLDLASIMESEKAAAGDEGGSPDGKGTPEKSGTGGEVKTSGGGKGDECMAEETIPFEEFMKVDLRVAKVLKVDNHPNADKLYVLTVDLGGEERTLVAGLRPYYGAADLEGRNIIVVANLAPAKLRGIESRGMLLAAEDDEGHVVFLTPEKEIPPGSKIH